jgi:penicillin-binding protein 1C
VVNYYKAWNPDFQIPPPWHPDIKDASQHLKIIFPDKSTLLYFGQHTNMTVNFKAMAEAKNTTLYWHVDENYIGATTNIHELQYDLPPGKHMLSIIDENGNKQQTTFNIAKTQ